MMIAPPGWECQPEEPPGLTVICAMAMSVPNLSGMVPCDVSVPTARGTFVSPYGGVASLGVTFSIMARPTSPTLSVAHRTARFMLPPCDRGVLLRGVACRVVAPSPAVAASNGCIVPELHFGLARKVAPGAHWTSHLRPRCGREPRSRIPAGDQQRLADASGCRSVLTCGYDLATVRNRWWPIDDGPRPFVHSGSEWWTRIRALP